MSKTRIMLQLLSSLLGDCGQDTWEIQQALVIIATCFAKNRSGTFAAVWIWKTLTQQFCMDGGSHMHKCKSWMFVLGRLWNSIFYFIFFPFAEIKCLLHDSEVLFTHVQSLSSFCIEAESFEEV